MTEQLRPTNQSETYSSNAKSTFAFRATAAASAVSELLKAHDYAVDAGGDRWNFAVEIAVLHRLGITDTDLRWLLLKDFLRHQCETSCPNDDRRTFEAINPLKFQPHSCFMLTDTGVNFARQLTLNVAGSATIFPLFNRPRSIEALKPMWDPVRRELTVSQYIVKHFRWPAPNQELVLTAFQEEHWGNEIDDPLIPLDGLASRERLHDTIKGLNRRQKTRLIQFRGNGTGEGVLWQFTPKLFKLFGLRAAEEENSA